MTTRPTRGPLYGANVWSADLSGHGIGTEIFIHKAAAEDKKCEKKNAFLDASENFEKIQIFEKCRKNSSSRSNFREP